jgi:endo-1,4-beta-mannosidase
MVPFTCALTASMSGKPTLMEEFGGCTAAPGQASYVWEWVAYGEPRKQFMASEEDLARYLEAVLPKLVEIGAIGAMVWCYADYIQELWDKPPCSESRHERFFGLVRPDGSLKPHAEVIKKFAATKPMVQETIPRWAKFKVSPDTYYQAPYEHLTELYKQYLDR